MDSGTRREDDEQEHGQKEGSQETTDQEHEGKEGREEGQEGGQAFLRQWQPWETTLDQTFPDRLFIRHPHPNYNFSF